MTRIIDPEFHKVCKLIDPYLVFDSFDIKTSLDKRHSINGCLFYSILKTECLT